MNYKELEKDMKKNLNQLCKEERKEFKYVMLKIKYSIINENDKYEFLQQLFDSVIIAQKEGRTLREVLGTNDIQEYCNMMLKEYKGAMSKKTLLLRQISLVIYLLLPFMIISGISNIMLNTENTTFTFSYTLYDLAFDSILVAWTLSERNIFYAVYKSKLLEFTNDMIAIFALIVLDLFLLDSLNSILLFSTNILLFSIASVILIFTTWKILKK